MRHSALPLALAACASPGGSGQWLELETEARDAPVIQLSGTVRHLDIEGGVFVIRDHAGTQYNPTNLPEPFQADGKAVEGEAVTNQETEYLAALGAAERWEIEEPFLRIYAAGRPEPLRFVRR